MNTSENICLLQKYSDASTDRKTKNSTERYNLILRLTKTTKPNALSASHMHCYVQMLLHGQYASTDDDDDNTNKEEFNHYLRMMMMMIETTQSCPKQNLTSILNMFTAGTARTLAHLQRLTPSPDHLIGNK